ncbi:lysylphosphatidylglycerol synthase domain-containing protein [Sphaerisporangium sp. TRM90804]|uniref:lysylphosphatidylglycerol synthase transmembrane domain-containing protein n=1 Tax=Sphaerisporangium sp. TRM90804 TaxID=3031113 RepID=UPI00244A7D92|nr:lysylphosphatidylglycerol synthase domain-containing protein [Sphaerisporangium sp. TRM90804]MDH2429087.1 lysylphosphatidylglycerol synthase domain-containing protein [Sphaerisporangium sp. TRM90804]
MRKKWGQVALSVASLALAVLLVVYLPQIVHALTGATVSWSEIGAQFGALSWRTVALMAALWLASLWAYTYVMTSALPGLTHLQALTLNGAGSAVSNLLPFGGAAGVALTFAMTKGWGFGTRPVVVYTLVTGIWNTLFRFILPAVGIVGLLVAGRIPNPTVTKAAWGGVISILALVAVVAAALYWERAADLLGRAADRLLGVLPRRVRPRPGFASEAVHRLRADTAGVLRSRWPGLSLGMTAFLVLQCLIMAACLVATGSYPGPAETVAVFALSRVLTSALITPSGAGIMEGGVATLLIAFGQPPGAATAAAILFGFWTYTIEIPWGGLALGGWSLLRRRDATRDRSPEPASQA